MEHVVILSKISNQTIGVIIGSFFTIVFLYELIRGKNFNSPTRSKQSVVIMPEITLQLKDLKIGTKIFILDADKEFIIAQTIENYQNGMKIKTFENTFWFDTEGKYTLEKGKTYEINSADNTGAKILHQINMFITCDSIVG